MGKCWRLWLIVGVSIPQKTLVSIGFGMFLSKDLSLFITAGIHANIYTNKVLMNFNPGLLANYSFKNYYILFNTESSS